MTANGPVPGPSFALSDEQQMLQKLARDFAHNDILPVVEECDRDSRFPRELCDKARALGLTNMGIPEAYGGLGASAMDEVVVAEELAYACTGISTSLSTNQLGALPIILAGSEEQKQYWLGERLQERGEFVSYGVTEAAGRFQRRRHRNPRG